MIIAFEGTDLSGKTTQVTLASNEFNIKSIKFPRERNLLINEYLKGEKSFSKDASFFIFLADIIDGIKEESNGNIICDRYVYSTVAYAQKISFENSKKIIELSPIKKADLVFYIDLDVEEYKKRINRELDKYEKDIEIQRIARERYLKMYEEGFFAKKWVKISSRLDIEDTFSIIKKEIERLI